MYISKKLLALGVAGIAITGVVGVGGIVAVGRLGGNVQKMITQDARGAFDAAELYSLVLAVRSANKSVMINVAQPEAREKAHQEVKENGQKLLTNVREAEGKAAASEKAMYQEWSRLVEDYLRASDDTVRGIDDGRFKTAFDANMSMKAYIEPMRNLELKLGSQIETQQKVVASMADELDSYLTQVRLVLGLAIAFGMGIMGMFAWRMSVNIVGRIHAQRDELAHITSQGDLTRRLPADGQDEMAEMSEGLNTFLEKVHKAVTQIAKESNALTSSGQQLSSASESMSSTASRAAGGASTASASASQVNAGIQTVSTATEELDASIRQISGTAQHSSTISAGAAQKARELAESVASLGKSSEEIGVVMRVINTIAEQTNLLALNATIEAARAGTAGKGFAVVANEVKDLAKQTASATVEISQKVSGIQSRVKEAVTAIGEITKVVSEVDSIASSIASAVHEQSAATSEIRKNVVQVATGSTAISENLEEFVCLTGDAEKSSGTTKEVATKVVTVASELESVVKQFRWN